MIEYRSAILTKMAGAWLARQYPGALIVEELSIGNWGSLRLDVAAICEEEIVAVEIKGDGDDMGRLKLQGPLYGLAATTAWLLPSPALAERAKKALPRGWGLLHVVDALSIHRDKYRRPARLPTSPGQMLQALWAVELRSVCDELGVSRRGMTTCAQWVDALAEQVPLVHLRPAICRALRRRDWSRPGSLTERGARDDRVWWAEASEQTITGGAA